MSNPFAGYLTTAEAGEIIGRSPSTIQRWCKTGKINDAVQIGYIWAIPIETANDLAAITPTTEEQLAINGKNSVAKIQAKRDHEWSKKPVNNAALRSRLFARQRRAVAGGEL